MNVELDHKKAVTYMSPYEAGQPTELTWRATRICASSECVEVAQRSDTIMVRDSVRPDSTVLRYASADWQAFVGAIKSGEFAGIRV
jgi:Domain of unknown function (DUF397)